MRRQSILVLAIPVLLFVNELMGDVVTIYPSDDAYIDSNVPDDNFGSTTYLSVGHGIFDEAVTRSYLMFNLSSIPANKTVISARLRLDPGYVSIPSPQVGAHYLASDAWDETTITWNNAPTGFNPTATDTITVNITESFWTVTEDVDDTYRGDGIYSVVMKLSDESSDTATNCSSSEAIIQDWWPYLEVEYSAQKYSGGTGEPNDPYLIETPNDLNSIGLDPCDWDKHFKMIADINMAGITGTQFNIIGTGAGYNSFSGVFDGNNHTISNFSYESGTRDRVGLFGFVGRYGYEAEIFDLVLLKPDINCPTQDEVGALIGFLDDGATVLRCGVKSGRVIGSRAVGGLVGWQYGFVRLSYFDGNVSGKFDAGGISGFAHGLQVTDPMIDRCYTKATVSCESGPAAGLAAILRVGLVENCYSLGDVNGTSSGGLVGSADNGAKVQDCYSGARIWGDEAGGVIGQMDIGAVGAFGCFWDVDVNPDVNGIGNADDPNVIGLPTEQMQKRSTFADAGWDMVNVWDIGENQTYPFLRTHLPGDINKDDETNFYDLAILAGHWLEGTE